MRFAYIAICFLPVSAALAQRDPTSGSNAQVTFYSHRVTLLGGLVGHSPAAFKGRLFDADEQLAFIEPGHFVTFEMTPGNHVFTAASWMAMHAKGGSPTAIDLAADQQYFLEVQVLKVGLGGTRTLVKEVTCEAAKQDNIAAKPLEPVHLRPAGRALIVSQTSFPLCSSDN